MEKFTLTITVDRLEDLHRLEAYANSLGADVRVEADRMAGAQPSFEAQPAIRRALDEGLRSLDEGRGVPWEEVRRRFRTI